MSFLSPSSYQELRRPSSTMMTTPHLLLSVIPALLVPLLVYVYRRRGKRQKGRLPPGRQGFPVVGETLQLISAYKTENPEPFIDDRVRKHGRVFTTHLFGERTVFSADPVVNRQVMQGEGKQFQASYPSSVATLLGRHSLVVSQGSLHKRMHSLTLGAFANPTVLRDFLLPDIDSLVRLNLRKWVDGQVLSLLDHAKKITFELAVKQLMSHEPSEWTEALRRQYLMVIDGFFALPVPFFPFTTYGRALKARRKVAEALRPVVRQRKKELLLKKKKYNSSSSSSSSSNDNDNDHAREEEVDRDNKISSSTKKKKNSNKNRVGGGKDVLDALLEEEAENGSLEEKGEEEVVDFLLALLVAGYETTPTLITSLVKFLTESPAALAQVRDEHDAIRSMKKNRDDDPLDWNDYKSSMPFTQCVINETLRMANIISGVFRRATTDVHIKGYTIPKGCKVFASFRGVHLDPDYYEDARTFNPWRWQQQPIPIPPQQQQELSVATSGGGSIIFTPFGGGPRMCPGYELGRLEISVFLHYLVTSFSWEATMEDSVIHFPTTRTVKGYPIRVRRRLSPAA